MKAYRRSRPKAPLILKLGTRRRLVVSIVPRLLYPRKRPGTHWIGGCVGPRPGLDSVGSGAVYVWLVFLQITLQLMPWTRSACVQHDIPLAVVVECTCIIRPAHMVFLDTAESRQFEMKGIEVASNYRRARNTRITKI